MEIDDPPWSTVPEMLRSFVNSERSSRECIVDGSRRITFAELAELADITAGGLNSLGVNRGDRVAIWAPNRWEWVVAACATLAAGAAIVPISTRHRATEASEVINRTRASTLIVGGDDARGQLGRIGELPHLESVVDLDPPGSQAIKVPNKKAGRLSFQDLITDRGARRAQHDPLPEDDCEILFTSGTTGQPKGVRLNHRQVLGNFWAYGKAAGFKEGDRYLVVVPFGHGGGVNGCMMSCLIHGVTNIPLARFDAAAALDIIDRESVTILMGPPQLFRRIMKAEEFEARDRSSLRITITGSAGTPPSLIKEMRDRGLGRVVNAYGLIEGSAVSMTRPGDGEVVATTSVGRPLPGVIVRIVDDDGMELENGEVGEILIHGPGVMQGYLDEPDLTASTIDDDGWLHTGDAGALDDLGNLTIVDRKKEMYIVSGFNVYPAEVERLLGMHPVVDSVAVIGISDPGAGEYGHAFVVPSGTEHTSEDEILKWADEHMTAYKVPRKITLLEELPLNPTGKADRKALRDLGQ